MIQLLKIAVQFVLTMCFMAGCMPHYRKSRFERSPVSADSPLVQASTVSQPTTIKPSGEGKFLLELPIHEVWDGVIDVLVKTYNIALIDRKSGLITTEWNSFYLGDELFRNKVSVRVISKGWKYTELVLLNSVETFISMKSATVGYSVWSPTDDAAGESTRIMLNLALSLKQPEPQLPPHMEKNKSLLDAKPFLKACSCQVVASCGKTMLYFFLNLATLCAA